MPMRAVAMRDGFVGMAVQMDVPGAVAMAMAVEMHAVAPQPPEHMKAEPDQHDADRGFERTRQIFRHGVAEQDRGAGEHQQRQRMTESPGQAVLDDVANVAAAGGKARHRRDVIGFQRMLHAEQKAEPQNYEHALSRSPRGSSEDSLGAAP